MNLFGMVPNINEVQTARPVTKSSQSTVNYTGPSFVENISDVARAAMIQVAGGSQAASAGVRKEKAGFDELFSFTKAESELQQEYVSHIKKLLHQFKHQ